MANPPDNWSQVVSTLYNLGQKKQKNVIQNLRKINYRYELQHQIQENSQKVSQEKDTKQREREMIVKLAQHEKHHQKFNKAIKIKKQQMYQLQNLNLMRQNNNTVMTYSPESNQFFQLEDNEKYRKIQTRRNFQLQNFLNSKQVEMKKKQKEREKNFNGSFKQMYNFYIQNEYQKQQTDRELWKNKYLYDKSMRQSQNNKNYKYAYRSFLKKQMEEQINKNSRSSEKIDEKLRGINQGIQNISPSPAYLGIVTQSFDRKTQMHIVDRNLHFQPTNVYRQIKKKQENEKKIIKAKASLPELKSNKEKIENKQYQTKPTKKVRQFTRYDLISGTQKTFFI